MKKIYMTIIAALAIVSCVKDNTTEVNKGRAIDFRVATTRAVETTTENLNNIWVTAVGETGNIHFSKVEFVKNGNYFTTTNEYYWPADGSDLSFYAYAPSETAITADGATLTLDGSAQEITDFSPKSAIKDQMDLIVAVTTGNKTNADNGVELIFDHALSQIQINAFTNNTGYNYLIKGVRIGKVVSTADFNFADMDWDLAETKSNYEITYDAPVTLGADSQSLMGDDGNAMLIPQTLVPWDPEYDDINENEGAYVAFKINITTAEGAVVFPKTEGEYDWVAMPIDTKWVRGFRYVYNFDFTDGAGYIDPEKEVDPENPDDPNGPGGEVLGGAIEFKHTMYGWSSTSDNVNF